MTMTATRFAMIVIRMKRAKEGGDELSTGADLSRAMITKSGNIRNENISKSASPMTAMDLQAYNSL